MTPKSHFLDEATHGYLVGHGLPADELLVELAAETAGLGAPAGMQIPPEQGSLLTVLTRMLRPRLAVEVGTFTGYSAVCIARGLPPEGRLICCDISEEWTAIARRYVDRAGLADRVEFRLAPAQQTLAGLPPDPPVDLVFLDADKTGYRTYWDLLVPRLSAGGVVLADNVLWGGRVLDTAEEDENTRAIREFNDHVAADERVEAVMLAVADGLTLARRRDEDARQPPRPGPRR